MTDLPTWLSNQIEKRDTNAFGLSHAIDVSHVTVGKWLNGTYTPNPANCAKLADFFGVSLAQVLRIAGHINSPPRDTGDLITEPHVTHLRIGEPETAYDPPCHDRPGLARLVAQLETLTDEQLESLAAFVETMGK